MSPTSSAEHEANCACDRCYEKYYSEPASPPTVKTTSEPTSQDALRERLEWWLAYFDDESEGEHPDFRAKPDGFDETAISADLRTALALLTQSQGELSAEELAHLIDFHNRECDCDWGHIGVEPAWRRTRAAILAVLEKSPRLGINDFAPLVRVLHGIDEGVRAEVAEMVDAGKLCMNSDYTYSVPLEPVLPSCQHCGDPLEIGEQPALPPGSETTLAVCLNPECQSTQAEPVAWGVEYGWTPGYRIGDGPILEIHFSEEDAEKGARRYTEPHKNDKGYVVELVRRTLASTPDSESREE